MTVSSSHYVNEKTMHGELDGSVPERYEGKFTALARGFALWVFHRLQAACDYSHSAEVIDESIAARDAWFTDDGSEIEA